MFQYDAYAEPAKKTEEFTPKDWKGVSSLSKLAWVGMVCFSLSEFSKPRLPDLGLLLMIVPGLIIPHLLMKMIRKPLNGRLWPLGILCVLVLASLAYRGTTRLLTGSWPHIQQVEDFDYGEGY